MAASLKHSPTSLHVISSMSLSAGGPTQSVLNLCQALTAAGARAEIATIDFHDGVGDHPEVPIHSFPCAFPAKLRRSPELSDFLQAAAGRFDIIHVHGLWEAHGWYALQAAAYAQRPLVVSPRGMLEPWCLRQKWLQKRVAMALWVRRFLQGADLIHATSEQEAESVRTLGITSPVAIVPNAIAFPPPVPRRSQARKRLLFISRIHPKKGLDLLLHAWAKVQPERSDWELWIVGPDEEGHEASLRTLSTSLGIASSVSFLGPMYGDAKWNLYAEAEMLILPSHSENFGNIIPEALGQGLPVIATQGTPWSALSKQGCGWWIPLSVDTLAATILDATGLTIEQLRAMGGRGSLWAREQFKPAFAATAILEAYRLVGKG